MNRPKSPCVRECGDRHAMCQLTCEKHAAYEEEKKRYYEEKDAERKKAAPHYTHAYEMKMRDIERKKREGRIKK